MRKLQSASLSNKEGLHVGREEAAEQGPLEGLGGRGGSKAAWEKHCGRRCVRLLFRCLCFALLRGDIEDVIAANEGVTVLGLGAQPAQIQSKAEPSRAGEVSSAALPSALVHSSAQSMHLRAMQAHCCCC